MQIPSHSPQLPPEPLIVPHKPRIVVSVGEQNLRVFDDENEQVAEFPVSTSKFGLGTEEGSHKTPLGQFAIDDMIGCDAPIRTVFRSRRPIGRWQPHDLATVGSDLVLSRIMWLTGLEEENANTRERYIYIHGTNQEEYIGTPASHGCIRMRNEDVVTLYDMVKPGTEVKII